MAEYDRTKSQVSENTKTVFLEKPWDAPLLAVPGIGPATVAKLGEANIHTLYQLAGVFLAQKGPGVDEDQWCNAFWLYLKKIGCPGGQRAGLIDCLGEKLALAFPGIYTPVVGSDEEDEEE